MTEPQTVPSETDAYNAGYNQLNDPEIITAWSYDPPNAYGHQQDGTQPQYVDQQPQSGTQPQSVEQQPQSGTLPQNPNGQTPIYGQQTPIYGQQTPNDGQQPQNYGKQPPNDKKQPLKYEQQLPIDEQNPPAYEQQPKTYEKQPQTYGQQPQTYEQQSQSYGQQPQSNGLQQQVYGQGQVPTIQQPMNMNVRSNADVYHSDGLCPAICVCLCCFWPVGIAAIVYASKATDAFKYGNIAEGHRYQRIARTLIAVSVVVGIIIGVIYGVLRYTNT